MKPLSEARVLLVGMGGLGSPAALILAQAGVGTLGLSDRDTVDLSNLHRQLLYRDDDIGRPKTVCAAAALQESFPRLQTERLGAISTQEAARIFSQWDVVIDGVDSIEMKFALSDAAVQSQTPLVHGGVVQQRGSVLSIMPEGPCYRCLFEEPPPPGEAPSCQEAGVFGATAGVIASLQAAEVLKILCQYGLPRKGRLLDIDLLTQRVREIMIHRNPDCRACQRATLTTNQEV